MDLWSFHGTSSSTVTLKSLPSPIKLGTDTLVYWKAISLVHLKMDQSEFSKEQFMKDLEKIPSDSLCFRRTSLRGTLCDFLVNQTTEVTGFPIEYLRPSQRPGKARSFTVQAYCDRVEFQLTPMRPVPVRV